MKACELARSVPFSRSFLQLLAARWWLAFFQGLTQAVFFQYSVNVLRIPLAVSIALNSVMVLLQLPVAWEAGRWCDQFREKQGTIVGMLVVSCAVPLWWLATPDRWEWLIVAYALWGGFGLLNVCGQSLCLKLAPQSHNSTHVALYEQMSGLIAGLAGLLGGWWLDQNLLAAGETAGRNAGPYLAIFLVSWLGRVTAPSWLWGLQQPVQREGDESAVAAAQTAS